MPGYTAISFVLTGARKEACPCCIGGAIARALGSTKSCLCGLFLPGMKKAKGLPTNHICLREVVKRGRLTCYMVQPGILGATLHLLFPPSHVEFGAICDALREWGDDLSFSTESFGYGEGEVPHHTEEPALPEPDDADERRLQEAIAQVGPSLWMREEEARQEQAPRSVPPPLAGHR